MKLKEKGRLVIANYGGNDDAAKAFSDRTGIRSAEMGCGQS